MDLQYPVPRGVNLNLQSAATDAHLRSLVGWFGGGQGLPGPFPPQQRHHHEARLSLPARVVQCPGFHLEGYTVLPPEFLRASPLLGTSHSQWHKLADGAPCRTRREEREVPISRADAFSAASRLPGLSPVRAPMQGLSPRRWQRTRRNRSHNLALRMPKSCEAVEI